MDKVKILVVDDYPANLVALGAVLTADEYQLIEATSGAEALRAVEEHDIALILLDIQMPGMDGYEVAKRIRQNPKTREIPIIFITAVYREDPKVRQGYAVGGQDYLGKPFDPEVLKAKVGIYSNLFLRTMKLEKEKVQLEVSEERYRLIVEQAQEIIATIDMTGTITSLNLAFERLTGLKCDEWIGKSFVPLLDADELTPILNRFGMSSRDQMLQLVTTRIRTVDGSHIPIEISIQPLTRDGHALGSIGIMRDVSQRGVRKL